MTERAGLRLIDALDELARTLVDELDSDACIVSRVLGDVLIIVSQYATDGKLINLGQGFLISDYPPTRAVIDVGTPTAMTVDDPGVDPAEAAVLHELGYGTLLMTPLDVAGTQWGLVELYRRAVRPFTANDVAAAQRLARVG